MKQWTWLFAASSVAALAACFSGNSGDPADAGGDALPCDVAQTLSQCQACHGSPLAASAPFTLMTYQDLTQASPQYPDQTVAERVVARMSDPNFPMPPNPLGPVAQSDIDTMQAWIDAGYPNGTCSPDPTGGTNPFATDPVCTDGQGTLFEGNNMRPGESCIVSGCHLTTRPFHIMGTVYPTAHEPNDCNGTKVTGVQVILTDSQNKTVTMIPNFVGNFWSQSGVTITPPYTVRVTYQGRERDMTGLVTAPTDGNCNNCHTQDGAQGAPGRILLP
ncbi:MAG TPA: hypothetical protein VGH28_14140 [Polyangiaceae bacterium]|jgi:mono/diheme cytochrome c family protein